MKVNNRKLHRNDPCWCGSGKKYKQCHMRFDERLRAFANDGCEVPDHTLIKTAAEIEGIRRSGRVNIAVLDAVGEALHPGMSTGDIDDIVREVTAAHHAIAAPLHYEGYPKSVCTSVNDQVCHGIPDASVVLHEGDIVNVDVSTQYEGFFSDSSRMFCVGEVSQEAADLVRITKECVDIGVQHVRPWTFLGDLGDAVHRHALEHGCSVVWEYGGHGIGLEFHEEPFVSFVSKPGTEMLMVPGMSFTIEPMVNLGGDEVVRDEENGWTVYTVDGSLSAQWEVQVVVTEDGCEIVAY
ncbi:MAG: methionyl aminopeptidase [Anaerovoracaceae bacterium]|jgi:methionyl aminopeptidase